MAIFNKFNQQADYSSNVTTIATGSKFTGKIEIECIFHIDGEFNGDINSRNLVTIGKYGVVTGELIADKLEVAGKFCGSAECESIELLAGGEVDGNLSAVSLAVDAESTFQGESIRKKPSEANANKNRSMMGIGLAGDSFKKKSSKPDPRFEQVKKTNQLEPHPKMVAAPEERKQEVAQKDAGDDHRTPASADGTAKIAT